MKIIVRTSPTNVHLHSWPSWHTKIRYHAQLHAGHMFSTLSKSVMLISLPYLCFYFFILPWSCCEALFISACTFFNSSANSCLHWKRTAIIIIDRWSRHIEPLCHVGQSSWLRWMTSDRQVHVMRAIPGNCKQNVISPWDPPLALRSCPSH